MIVAAVIALSRSGVAAPAEDASVLASARRALDAGKLDLANQQASDSATKSPSLGDYAAWVAAQAEYRLKNYAEVASAVRKILAQETPSSPLTAVAAQIAVQAALDSGHAGEGLELLRKFYERIPQPQGDLLFARCFQATGDLPHAAEYFQRVYYRYPSAKEAADAATALVDVKQRLADAYPPPTAAAMSERAGKLFDTGNPSAARIELAAAIQQLSGADRDLARVRLGVADYLSNNTAAAFQYFSALKVDDAESDAERLSYLIRCARTLDRHADVKSFLQQLEKDHAQSKWRMETLIYIADQGRVENDRSVYLPLYEACATTFEKERRAAWCEWQVAFEAYRRAAANALELLKSELRSYGDSKYAENALYFLGKQNESEKQEGSARACYERLTAKFPNTYYAVLARARLKEITAPSSAAMVSFLDEVHWPSPAQFPSFTASDSVDLRLHRASLLASAGMQDLAEGELKFGARNDGEQPNVYAFELAKMASARNAPDEAMRDVRIYAPGYLFMPLDQAPAQFWQLAFPLPYRAAVQQYSAAQNLDPYLVAALIRQESEWNAAVISHANAYGLMQLVPRTGRQLARHFGSKRLNAQQLLNPTRNIQLGTLYFHNLLDAAGGQPEIALAAYNAGPTRSNLWRSWGPFREPAEFVEVVPFHETREYIQLVLRNADLYRRLYSGLKPDVPAYSPKRPRSAKSKTHIPST
jgi:peptidoglycan lytic transglycosylase